MGKGKFVSLSVLTLLITSLVFVSVSLEQSWYFKPSYIDYAPSGLPDFDQRQKNWTNPLSGKWSWCGPLAAVNSLWWFDSKFEPNPVAPPPLNDGFPLLSVWAGLFDDHNPSNVQPFVERLAWYMDTDGMRTGLSHSGTRVHDMEAGIAQYLQSQWPLAPVGLIPLGDANGDGKVDGDDEIIVLNAMGSFPGMPNWNLAADLNGDNMVDPLDLDMVMLHFGEAWGKFYEKTVKMPTFQYIAEQVEASEDVVVLLGFWQNQTGGWVRFGGHYVTVAGVNSVDLTLAFSDPSKNDAELGYPGQVLPAPPHPHPPTPPFTLHNNASYVSHDFYDYTPLPPCPGGNWGPGDYNRSIPILVNFTDQNFPQEFDEEAYRGPYNPAFSVYVYTEYAVVVSPTPDPAATNVVPERTVIPPSFPLDINVTVANQGLSTETFNVTAYYHETQGFESGTFGGWSFTYSTNGLQEGTVDAGSWSSTIVSGTDLISGTYSARLLANSTASYPPWRVDAAINQTVNRASGEVLRATLKFKDVQGSGGVGLSLFAVYVFNALDTSKYMFYGFSTTGDYGDIRYTVSPGDLVDFQRNFAADYQTKYGVNLPDEVMIRFQSSADYAEGIPERRTTDVIVDDICVMSPITPIGEKTVTLAGGDSANVTFTWNTAGLPLANYIITAWADISPEEADTADNTYIGDMVVISTFGDVNGDGYVNIFDLLEARDAIGSEPGYPNWNPNVDLNDDGYVNIFDLILIRDNIG